MKHSPPVIAAIWAIWAAWAFCACGDNSNRIAAPDGATQADAPVIQSDAPAAKMSCTTNVTTTGFGELCRIDGDKTVEHVRLAGVQAPATHASAAVFFGFAAAPTAADLQTNLAAGQVRVLIYGGGPAGPTTIPPVVQITAGTTTETLAGDTSWVNAGADICFDLHDGSATTTPAFAMWVTGQNGADCATASTLTTASAFALRSFWHGAIGAVDKAQQLYFYQASSITAMPAITLDATAATTDAQIAAGVQCSTTFAATTDWQPLCTNAGGATRFVTMTNAASTVANNFFYTVIGQDAAPTGNPAQGTGKLIVTGGKANDGSSWTYFRFNNGSTMQYVYKTDAGDDLYTVAPTTVCYDLGTASDEDPNLRVVFWATGAKGADCATRSTLTLANALYDSTTDAATGTIWNAPLAAGKLDFAKLSNTGASLQSVAVSSEPAVLP